MSIHTYVSTDATSVRFFLNYPVYCEHGVILPGATRSKVPTEAVLTVSSYTVMKPVRFIIFTNSLQDGGHGKFELRIFRNCQNACADSEGGPGGPPPPVRSYDNYKI